MKRRLFVSLTLSCAALATLVHAQLTPTAGSIPHGLPARLAVGLFENPGETWMKDSGVAWDLRYAYFVAGWANNWGHGSYDGTFASRYFAECDALHTIPAVQYYQMNGEPGGGEAAYYAKTKDPSTMRGYFSDFKLLLQRAKEFRKPVVVMIEADGPALLAKQTAHDANAYAAIAASEVLELARLPNSVAGWGLAFLQLRKEVGASNVALGMHVSGWTSGKDVLYASVTEPLQSEVDAAYRFLAPLGLAPNVTGETYDFLVGDPVDRGLDFDPKDRARGRWLDASASASIDSRSFNRLAEWLRLWNVKSGRRWLLAQVPLGDKDGFAEYFFGAGSSEHRDKFASSGLFGLLFGAGAGTSKTDTASGKLSLQKYVASFLALPGNHVEPAPAPVAPAPRNKVAKLPTAKADKPVESDSATYDFERTTEGWISSGAPIAGLAASTEQKFAGKRSLGIRVEGNGTASVSLANPKIAPGKVITLHVYLPAKSSIAWVQPYVLQGASSNYAWTGNFQEVANLKAGAWNTMTVQVPSTSTGLTQLGVQFATSAPYSGSLYLDEVSY